MKLTHLAAAALLLIVSSGCSSLARGGVAGARAPEVEDDKDDFGPLPVSSYSSSASAAVAPPGQMEVSWTDNGIPIRQLTGDGKPQEMKLPDSKVPKKPLVKPASK